MVNVGSPSSINYRKEKYWKTKGYVSLSDIRIGTYIFDKDWVESKVGLKGKESIKQKKYLIKIWIQSCWFKLSDFTHLHLNQCDSTTFYYYFRPHLEALWKLWYLRMLFFEIRIFHYSIIPLYMPEPRSSLCAALSLAQLSQTCLRIKSEGVFPTSSQLTCCW